jgi:DNA (cytosine-5)-methyltransferase 1
MKTKTKTKTTTARYDAAGNKYFSRAKGPQAEAEEPRAPLLRVHLDDDELVIDNFAGGGGASSGIEWATNRSPDIAINHDPEAIELHRANHPSTRHYVEDIFDVSPTQAVAELGSRRVGLLWASPDCKHFSSAKAGVPLDNKIRGLAWAVVNWATEVSPRIICMENVPEFEGWCDLGKDGRPIKAEHGKTFREFVGKLEALGYKVEWRVLKACDYGAPTSRKRLFLVARNDGRAIVWPEASHGPGRATPYRTAAECIDWSVAAPSIFERSRKHADATLARIARGIRRYVVQAAQPFLAPVTVPSAAGQATVASYLVHRSNGERPTKVDPDGTVHAGQAPRVYSIEEPLGTVMAQGQKQALIAAMLLKHNGGNNDAAGSSGQELTKPIDSITARDSKSLATVSLALAKDPEARRRARAVYSFLIRYNGKGEPEELTKPLGSLTTHDRYGLVTVTIGGEEYVITDIGMRMLTPRELFTAQGFAPDYDITAESVRGTPLTKTAQVRCVGNSVAPPIAAAIVRAQLGYEAAVPAPAPAKAAAKAAAPVVGDHVSFLDDEGQRRTGEVVRVSSRQVVVDDGDYEWGVAPKHVDIVVASRMGSARRAS